MNVSVTVKGKVELSSDEEGSAVHSRGENVTYYLAWEHMDLSHPSNRYRDELEQQDYDWGKWGMNVVAGVAVVAGAAALAAGGVGFLAGAGAAAGGGAASGTAGVTATGAAAGAAKATGMAVFLTGSLYVAEQAVSDAVSGRLSETEKYARKALAGSVVGFLTGASGLLMQGSGLGKVLALGFGEGFLGSIVTQALLNEDGEINWALAFGEGAFSAAVTGMAWEIGGNTKRIEGGSGTLDGSVKIPKPGDSDFMGPLTKSEQHFIYGDGIGPKKRGVLGAHNLESFDNTLKSTGYSLEDLKVGNPIPHPMVDGVYAQYYRVPAYDGRGNFIGFKDIPDPKTYYDPDIISNSQMLQWGKEAMKNASPIGDGGYLIKGIVSNGLEFYGYLRDGEITNFFPSIPK